MACFVMLEIQSRCTGFGLFPVAPVDRVDDVGEDQFALASGVAGVDDLIDVVANEKLVDHIELLGRFRVARLQLELVGNDRKVVEFPPLQLLVVVLGLGERDEVAYSPGDDVLVGLQIPTMLLESTRQRAGEIGANGRFLSDYQCFGHGNTLANASNSTPISVRVSDLRDASFTPDSAATQAAGLLVRL